MTDGDASAEMELPLDERIVILTNLLGTELPEADRPEVLGELGEAWVEHYADSSDESALTTATGYLHRALDYRAADPVSQLRWRYWLGVSYGELGSRRRSLDDYDTGANLLDALLDSVEPADQQDYDLVLVSWMELLWERFWTMRYAVDGARDGIGPAVDKLVADLSSRAPGGPDAGAVHTAAVYLGAARIKRFDLTGRRPDLDAGIAALAEHLPEVPADVTRLPLFRVFLAEAYRTRAEVDDDPVSLDLAIETGRSAIAAIDRDAPTWGMIQLTHALACERRWDRNGDPADLDEAIESWRAEIADDLDDYVAWRGGDLLRQRAERGGGQADIAETIELFTYAAHHIGHDEHWLPWYRLGEVFQVRATILGDPGSLDDAVDCFERALDLGVPDDDVLCAVHTTRLEAVWDAARADAGGNGPDVAARLPAVTAEADSVYDGLPDGDPHSRALLAGQLAMAHLHLAPTRVVPLDTERVSRLAEAGRSMPDAPAEWLAAMDVAARMVQYLEGISTVGGRVEAVVADLARFAEDTNLDIAMRASIRKMLPALLQGRSQHSGDRRGTRAAVEMFQQAAASDPEMAAMSAMAAAQEHLERGEHDAFLALFRESEQQIEALAPPMAAMYRQLAVHLEGRTSEPAELRLPAVDGSGYALDTEIASCVVSTGYRYLDGVANNDLSGLRMYGRYLDSLGEIARPDRVAWLGLALLAGVTWLEAARRDRASGTDALRAVYWNGQAVRSAVGPRHPLWSRFTLRLAESLRLTDAPDLARSRSLGRSAMAGHAWLVLMQSGSDHAIQVARDAAADAVRVARWCLADGADDDLLSVLDSGRGLCLQAATASRGIADQLDAAGHPDLAVEWRATAGMGRNRLTGETLGSRSDAEEIPDDLRERVLHALSTGEVLPDGVVTDVRLSDVQSALAVAGTDALVYLLPPDDDGPGLAVIVPAAGPVETLPLPALTTGAETVIDRWVASAPSARDANPVRPKIVDDKLDELCRWAWIAGAGPLVGHARGWGLGRPAHLVLVPMGPLGLVPWHAAYRLTPAGRRYAVEDMVVSYSVSARTFIRAAHQPHRPIRSSLVVGDPTGGLTFAGIEARAVHERFHPDGTYLTGDATPDAVIDWLNTAPGPSLLHFACHATVDPRSPLDAHLLLADDRTLTARRLLDVCRLGALEIEYAFLAACSTHSIGADYDETLSLATVLIAAGTHTVFGSLWPVPDTDTSMLMYMIHHHLGEGHAPAYALHRAQRWMLDPRREPPDGMPLDLAGLCAGPNLARPIAWAGFAHLGR